MKRQPVRQFFVGRALVFLALAALFAAGMGVEYRIRQMRQGPPPALNDAKPAAEILYLAPSRQPELWSAGLEGLPPRKLTSTGGGVYDYMLSFDGNWVAFSALNAQGGYDLWEIDRKGSNSGAQPALLLPCGTDWCISPAYAPDSRRVAYSRRRFSGIAGSQPGAPHIWIYDRETRQTDTLMVDPNIGGASPAWSPDGRFLAFVDSLQQAVHVVELQGEIDFALRAGADADFSWSPDSRSLLVTRSGITGENPYTSIVKVDPISRQESILIDDQAAEFSVPVWSPDGRRLATARRAVQDVPGKQIWLLEPDGQLVEALTDNPLANHAAIHWSPDSTRLVFQRLTFGSSSSLPEVLVWDSRDHSLRVLAEDAFQPTWVR